MTSEREVSSKFPWWRHMNSFLAFQEVQYSSSPVSQSWLVSLYSSSLFLLRFVLSVLPDASLAVFIYFINSPIQAAYRRSAGKKEKTHVYFFLYFYRNNKKRTPFLSQQPNASNPLPFCHLCSDSWFSLLLLLSDSGKNSFSIFGSMARNSRNWFLCWGLCHLSCESFLPILELLRRFQWPRVVSTLPPMACCRHSPPPRDIKTTITMTRRRVLAPRRPLTMTRLRSRRLIPSTLPTPRMRPSRRSSDGG